MIPNNLLKGALAVLASGAGGFYVGGRYVGELALPSYALEKPAWVKPAQSMMWIMLAVCALCVLLWIAVDYRSESA